MIADIFPTAQPLLVLNSGSKYHWWCFRPLKREGKDDRNLEVGPLFEKVNAVQRNPTSQM
jgi:hypothetical protein